MSVSYSRNKVASRIVAPMVYLVLLFLLGGCLGTPKTAPTQFSNFSSATNKMSDDVVKIYEFTYALHEENQKKSFILSTEKNISALDLNLSYLSPYDLAFRKLLFNALKAYALSLKYIMSNEIDTAFDSDTTKLVGSLTSMQKTLLPKVSLPPGITESTITTAANKVANWFLADKKQKVVLQSLNDVTPELIIFINTIKGLMGTCGDSKEATDYCKSVPTPEVSPSPSQRQHPGTARGESPKTLTSPFVSWQVCNNFRELVALYADEAVAAKTPAAIQAQRNSMISYRIKRDRACEMLNSIQAALSAYADIVTNLPDIFSRNKSKEFSTYIMNLNTQLFVVEQLLPQASL